jgi:hypothetical protein
MGENVFDYEKSTVESAENPRQRHEDNDNPSPADDRRCECCGKHISELKPFDGPLLVRMFRPYCLPDEEANRIYEEYYGKCSSDVDYKKAREALERKYGSKKADNIELTHQGSTEGDSSYECRDCAILDNPEYFKKYVARLKKKQ